MTGAGLAAMAVPGACLPGTPYKRDDTGARDYTPHFCVGADCPICAGYRCPSCGHVTGQKALPAQRGAG